MAATSKTAARAKAEVHRCPHCGSSDVALEAAQGKLKCHYCHTVFEPKVDNALGGVKSLAGETVGEGAEDIIPGEDIILTLKCPSCGAEVVVNATDDLSVECHWCRHILTIEHKIKNGAVPDLVLPFKITKADAEQKMRDYVMRFADVNPDFKSMFDPSKIIGVYFPYLIVDVNAHWNSIGDGERTVSNRPTPPYRVETYEVTREFDIFVDDLTVESSSNRLNQDTFVNSNNVINAILPFDTENAVAWDANYLRGYASEKRDVNLRAVKEVVALQSGDIARRKAKEATSEYDRGVHWQREHLGIKGTKWKSAYLPVWIYSWRRPESTGDKRIYYIALNARTGEVVGDIPLGMPTANSYAQKPVNKVLKGFGITYGVAAGVFVLGLLSGGGLSVLALMYQIFALPFWLFALIVAACSRQQNAQNVSPTVLRTSGETERHTHEDETRCEVGAIKRTDKLVVTRAGVYTHEIIERNDSRAIGSLSSGRDSMITSERGRFAMGGNYSHTKTASPFAPHYVRPGSVSTGRSISVSGAKVAKAGASAAISWIIILVFVFLVLLAAVGGSGGSSGGYSSYDYDSDSGSSWSSSSYDYDDDDDYDSSWSSGSSWDSGSSWSSSDSGFDYSYDY